MSRRRVTESELISRLKNKFSNEDGSLIQLDNYQEVNEFLKEVRRVTIEYKIIGLDYNMIKLYDDDNLLLEYRFRHNSPPPTIERYEFSKFIDWCYLIGMTEKNQIRKRLEFYDKSYIDDQHGLNPNLTLTKIIRNYRNLYKEYGKEEETQL